ncbi:MAG: hypothetical protein ACREUR_03005 [Nitrosospira sp.]
MIRCRREGGWRNTVAAAFSLLVILLVPMTGFAQEYEYRCTPDTQYECTGGQCEKLTDGFQHAESFIYNTKTSVLSACLWTNCYAARAISSEDAAGATGTMTAIGKLAPTAHPGNEPVIVSLTIHAGNHGDATDKKAINFTAVWGYGSKGLTLDMGECAPQELP